MYWEGKCFFCLFYGTLLLMIGLSSKPIYKDIKSSKKNKSIVVDENKSKSDSITTNY